MSSPHDPFYQEAEKALVGRVDNLQRQLTGFVSAMRHAAERCDRQSWLDARATFSTLRASADDMFRALEVVEREGDAEFKVMGLVPRP